MEDQLDVESHQTASAPGTEAVPRCPITGSYQIRHRGRVTDHSCTGETFQLWENKESGIRFTWPMPSPDGISRYYDTEQYLSHNHEAEGAMATMYQLARSFTLKWKLRIILKRMPVSAVRLLDFGAGTGDFAGYVKQQKPGWQVKAIEPNPQAAAYAQTTHKLSVYDNMDAFPVSEKFSVITAWHVLEHVHRPDLILEQFHKRLFEYGLLIIALPNHTSFDARHYGTDWAAWDVPRHLFHFSPAAFKKLAAEIGFEIVDQKRMLLDSFYVSLLSETYQKKSPSGVFNAFMVGFWSDCISLMNAERCSSVTYILRKHRTA